MTLEVTLFQRADAKCELCGADNDLVAHSVPPVDQVDADHSVLLCPVCKGQVEEAADVEVNHWRCLNDSMWSQVAAVQVTAWRMLNRLSGEAWARDLLDMMYMEDDVRTWAEAGLAQDDAEEQKPCKDSNGNTLNEGDTVTLIKDLDVKGGGFTAKRGTAVRNIHLTDNPEHIEGRVNGTSIVLLTCFLKKA
jgi:protein PhnA